MANKENISTGVAVVLVIAVVLVVAGLTWSIAEAPSTSSAGSSNVDQGASGYVSFEILPSNDAGPEANEVS